MISRSLCKIRSKYTDLKQVKIDLENQLMHKVNFENLTAKNIRLGEQGDTFN